ncbi:hypothetical protein KUCAC02_003581, partial [Chaenocephalus aceratus]
MKNPLYWAVLLGMAVLLMEQGQHSGCKEQGRETSGAMARDTDSEELKAFWLSAARCRLYVLMAVDMN